MSEQAGPSNGHPERLLVYHHPNCGTCKKALGALKAAGAPVELVDLRAQAPSVEELRALVACAGLPIRRWFNTSGQSYRTGGWAARMADLSEDDALQALSSDGLLIRRPILVLGDAGPRRVLVGFDAAAQAALLAERRA
jgi:arsenate reductase